MIETTQHTIDLRTIINLNCNAMCELAATISRMRIANNNLEKQIAELEKEAKK